MRHDFEGARSRSHEGGHDAIAGPIDETGVLVPDAEPQILREDPDRFDELQEFTGSIGMVRVDGGFDDRLPRPEEFELTRSQVAVVATVQIDCEEDHGQRKKS